MEINELITKVQNELMARTRPETQRFYNETIKTLRTFFLRRNIIDIDDITFDVIIDLINSCHSAGLSNKTINNKLEVIKKIIRRNNIITSEQKIILDYRYLPHTPVAYMPLSKDDLYKFIKWVKELPTENHIRNLKKKCMFLLALQNGIRNTEMLEIKVRDLLMDTNRIKLSHTKSGNVRYAYFNDYTKDLLIKYIEQVKPQTYLFENRITHERLNSNSYCDVFTNASNELGINVSSHILRATFATRALRAGCNIESIRIMMGHTNLQTTQMYLHMSDEELFEDNQAFNPLAQYDNENNENQN